MKRNEESLLLWHDVEDSRLSEKKQGEITYIYHYFCYLFKGKRERERECVCFLFSICAAEARTVCFLFKKTKHYAKICWPLYTLPSSLQRVFQFPTGIAAETAAHSCRLPQPLPKLSCTP